MKLTPSWVATGSHLVDYQKMEGQSLQDKGPDGHALVDGPTPMHIQAAHVNLVGIEFKRQRENT